MVNSLESLVKLVDLPLINNKMMKLILNNKYFIK